MPRRAASCVRALQRGRGAPPDKLESTGHLDQAAYTSPILELDGDLDRDRPRPQTRWRPRSAAATGFARTDCHRGSEAARSSRAEQLLHHGVSALHGVECRGIAALEHIVDEGVGNALQGAALLAGGVRPSGTRQVGQRDGVGDVVAETRIETRVRVELRLAELEVEALYCRRPSRGGTGAGAVAESGRAGRRLCPRGSRTGRGTICAKSMTMTRMPNSISRERFSDSSVRSAEMRAAR